VPVDLGGAQESDVNPLALQPVREHLGNGHDGVGRLGQLAVADRKR
jgi:hypothetical protein